MNKKKNLKFEIAEHFPTTSGKADIKAGDSAGCLPESIRLFIQIAKSSEKLK